MTDKTIEEIFREAQNLVFLPNSSRLPSLDEIERVPDENFKYQGMLGVWYHDDKEPY